MLGIFENLDDLSLFGIIDCVYFLSYSINLEIGDYIFETGYLLLKYFEEGNAALSSMG